MKKRYWSLVLGFWLAPASAASAASDSLVVDSLAVVRADRPWWVGVWGGVANNSPIETRHGERYRDFHMAGLRVGREMHASSRLAFDVFVDIVPWIRSTNNPVRYVASPTGEVMETATARGYGLTPAGLQMRAFRGSPVELVVGSAFGMVMYDRPIPDPDERRFNFIAEVSLGLQARIGESGALLGGIRQSHTSNANTGPVNPGMNSLVLYVGIVRPVGRRSKP